MISKFQNAGKIEVQEPGLMDKVYDFSHKGGSGLAYQLVNGGLYLAAPFTGGLSLIPATAMSAAAIGSTAHNMTKDGVNLNNGVDMAFDVANALPGAGLALKSVQTAGKIGKATKASQVAFDAVKNASNSHLAAIRAAEEAAKQTAKAKAKRDALSQVLLHQGKTATYNPAWRAADQEVARLAKLGRYVGDDVFTAASDGVRRIASPNIAGTLAEKAIEQGAKSEVARQAERRAIQAANAIITNAENAKHALYMYAPWAVGSNAVRPVMNGSK